MYDQFVNNDWARGQAGTREFDYGLVSTFYESFSGEIAESWKIPEIGTWIFQIRKGIFYGLNPNSEASRLMNGREFTADDAVWNVRRLHTDPAFPKSYPRIAHPAMSKAVTAEKTGPWEITLKTPVDPWTAFFWVVWGGCNQNMYAREVVEKYGDQNDWKNVVGTGPWMLTDYVSQSVATFKKHPNWYKKNPAGPGKGNQIPYSDTMKIFIIPDISTRLATMRTGKADWISEVQGEDARSLLKSNPQLSSKRYLTTGLGIGMRIDIKELPFKDTKVRQALAMAIDREAIARDLYDGDAETHFWPAASIISKLHIPLNELPESVQEIYKYNPEKAKRLLTEAGYPNGFKTKLLVQNTSDHMDPASILKEMWAKVGVEAELQPRDFAVYRSHDSARSWDELIIRSLANVSVIQVLEMYPQRQVRDRINDPVSIKAFNDMQKDAFINMPKVYDIYRQIVPYLMEQAHAIPVASPYTYTLWQPWLKNHFGETGNALWTPYAWVDQDLKEKMTGRR